LHRLGGARKDGVIEGWYHATDRVRGQPDTGAELADELEQRIVALHGEQNIAAVIVEPLAGSTGVLVPPKGYLQRLRDICDRYNLLLVFDEVITGFGRFGGVFSADVFGVVPDMILFAKTISNGAAPLGGVIVHREIHDAIMQGPMHLSELMHGYTCSGHPLACAAGLAMLDVIEQESLVDRVKALTPYFENAVHQLAELPSVVSVRNCGLAAGIELAAAKDQPGRHGARVQQVAFDLGLLTRAPGDALVLAPPFVSTPDDIQNMVQRLADAIVSVSKEREFCA
jgi:beta-alanine--pyruvate transaminase